MLTQRIKDGETGRKLCWQVHLHLSSHLTILCPFHWWRGKERCNKKKDTRNALCSLPLSRWHNGLVRKEWRSRWPETGEMNNPLFQGVLTAARGARHRNSANERVDLRARRGEGKKNSKWKGKRGERSEKKVTDLQLQDWTHWNGRWKIVHIFHVAVHYARVKERCEVKNNTEGPHVGISIFRLFSSFRLHVQCSIEG